MSWFLCIYMVAFYPEIIHRESPTKLYKTLKPCDGTTNRRKQHFLWGWFQIWVYKIYFQKYDNHTSCTCFSRAKMMAETCLWVQIGVKWNHQSLGLSKSKLMTYLSILCLKLIYFIFSYGTIETHKCSVDVFDSNHAPGSMVLKMFDVIVRVFVRGQILVSGRSEGFFTILPLSRVL